MNWDFLAKLENTETNSTGRSILIVDDQELDASIPAAVARKLGYSVIISVDGLRGLNQAMSQGFDFIILDWNMPTLNGLEMLTALDSLKPLLNHQPKVIIYSGTDLNFSDLGSLKRLQITEIWKKPFSAAEILARLKKLS